MGVKSLIAENGGEIASAVEQNDLPKLRELLEKNLKTDAKIRDVCQATITNRRTKASACPLIEAARLTDPAILRYMLQKGVNPNFAYNMAPLTAGRQEVVTPLHVAVEHGNVDVVDELLAANADCNVRDYKHDTPLHIATFKVNTSLVRTLLTRGADPTISDRHGDTPLHIAARIGHRCLISALVFRGADVNQRGANGALPVQLAASEGHAGGILTLFRIPVNAASIDEAFGCRLGASRNWTALHLAAAGGHHEAVRELIDSLGAAVDVRDDDGNTALHCVVMRPYNGRRMRESDCFRLTALALLERHIDVEARNVFGDSPLHLAAMNHYPTVVELLLEFGAKPDVENLERLKPIDIVHRDDHVTRELLKKGVTTRRDKQLMAAKTSMPVRAQRSDHPQSVRPSATSGPGAESHRRSCHSTASQTAHPASNSVDDVAYTRWRSQQLRDAMTSQSPPPPRRVLRPRSPDSEPESAASTTGFRPNSSSSTFCHRAPRRSQSADLLNVEAVQRRVDGQRSDDYAHPDEVPYSARYIRSGRSSTRSLPAKKNGRTERQLCLSSSDQRQIASGDELNTKKSAGKRKDKPEIVLSSSYDRRPASEGDLIDLASLSTATTVSDITSDTGYDDPTISCARLVYVNINGGGSDVGSLSTVSDDATRRTRGARPLQTTDEARVALDRSVPYAAVQSGKLPSSSHKVRPAARQRRKRNDSAGADNVDMSGAVEQSNWVTVSTAAVDTSSKTLVADGDLYQLVAETNTYETIGDVTEGRALSGAGSLALQSPEVDNERPKKGGKQPNESKKKKKSKNRQTVGDQWNSEWRYIGANSGRHIVEKELTKYSEATTTEGANGSQGRRGSWENVVEYLDNVEHTFI